MKKIIFLITSFLLCFSVFAKPINSTISGLDFTKQMGFGWNLGNTLDATNGQGVLSETSWGQPLTTKEMIDGIAASGIKTIRIPVSWHNHIVDTDTYKVDSQWMARVKTVVDWALEDGLFVILNTHHDNAEKIASVMNVGQGYYPNSQNLAESEKFLTVVWGQICETFNNNYDEHLIFETLNEPRLIGHNHEWSYVSSCKECKDCMNCVKYLNQSIVDTIRKSGGNNAKRFIAAPSIACGFDSLISDDFELPQDKANRIIAAVHMYTPYPFAMDPNPSITKFTASHKSNLTSCFEKLDKKFISKGIPVYVGEMGATNKDNLSEREAWFDFFVKAASEKSIPAVLWDNGSFNVSDKKYGEKYGFYCRTQAKWYFPSLIKVSVEAAGGKAGSIPLYDSTYEYGFNSKKAVVLIENFDTKNWGNSITIPKAKLSKLKEGSIIKIVTKPSVSKEKSYSSLSFRDTSWKDLSIFTGTVLGEGSIYNNSVNPKSEEAVYYWVLSDSDAKTLTKQDVLLCGNNVNVVSLSVQY